MSLRLWDGRAWPRSAGSRATTAASRIRASPVSENVISPRTERRLAALGLAVAVTACGGAAPIGTVSTPAAAPPAATAAIATPASTPVPTAAVRDPYSCAERVTVPDVADAVNVAWSPDGKTLAVAHTVVLPRQFTGTPEDYLLDALDITTGTISPIAIGERPQWSGSGRYVAFWDWNEQLKIAVGDVIVGSPNATMRDMRWSGDTLYFFEGDAIRAWTAGEVRTVAELPAGTGLRYPADDAYFSADARRFTVTRYAPDATARRFIGDTRDGSLVPLVLDDALYTEWAPAGDALLVRYADRIALRDGEGRITAAPLASFPGPEHVWTPDGRSLLMGAVSATTSGVVRFDAVTAWGAMPAAPAGVLPDLVGTRAFSPDGRLFAGVSRTPSGTRLEVFRCGTRPAAPSLATGAATRATTDGHLLRPAVGAITQYFHPGHTGVDLAAPYGSLLTAADEGVVSAVGPVEVGGRRVCMRHPSGLQSCYYHTSAPLVAVGQRVSRGQPVALVGMTGATTGPHVHWEVDLGGRLVDPLAR